jgi:hypothetical protein
MNANIAMQTYRKTKTEGNIEDASPHATHRQSF